MFIEDTDYRVVIGETALKVLSQCDAANRDAAQAQAIEEIAGYLRPKYNCQAIFAAQGAARNPQLVMYAVDIALYHLSSSLPQRLGSEVRKERYDRAIQWLTGVQRGSIVPDLPLANGATDDTSATILYTSEKKLKHLW